MTDINDDLPEGATPLEPDDLQDLLPTHIETRSELNTFEAMNIREGLRWGVRKGRTPSAILDQNFCVALHRNMTNRTWRWAGQFRTRDVNIGDCPPYLIPERVRNVLDNTLYWVENETFKPDEICVRLHRDLVWIHPFVNVNGRHSRIMADLLGRSLSLPPFTWGGGNLMEATPDRDQYLLALREGDQGNFDPLLEFVRS